ncbi:MAG: GTPase Era [Tenericutes bacterium]|jgi:GTPase|nr:GTPase Era [Mycoplasmatota bacterium]MDD6942193.1 GTPase Era [bacterium]MDY2696688.1 GTPase Era [Bacilli bacterium]
MKCGFVSLVGRPNVGKSTLLNSVLGMKLAITSNVSGTTRNVIQGIYNDDDSQIIFVDTPGIHKPNDKLGTLMNKKAYTYTEGVDVILFLVDISKGFGKGDKFILDKFKEKDAVVFLLLNKIDLVKDKSVLLERINELKELYDFKEIIPISALKDDNIKLLIDCIKKYLPESEAIYSEEELTNVTTRFIISEFVREKILELTRDEVPHTVTCYVENYEEDEKTVHIQVLIVVDRDNIKKIIIGKQGQMLKEIGTRARHDMEEFLGKKVYLETYVKTLKNWRDQEKYFLELGLKEEDM